MFADANNNHRASYHGVVYSEGSLRRQLRSMNDEKVGDHDNANGSLASGTGRSSLVARAYLGCSPSLSWNKFNYYKCAESARGDVGMTSNP